MPLRHVRYLCKGPLRKCLRVLKAQLCPRGQPAYGQPPVSLREWILILIIIALAFFGVLTRRLSNAPQSFGQSFSRRERPAGEHLGIRADGKLAKPLGLAKAQFSLDRSKNYDVCVVGAGLSGTILAERFATVLGKSVVVLDNRRHVGGNSYDFVDEPTGILMNKYGPHVLRSNDEAVWRYVNSHPDAPRWVRWKVDERAWVLKNFVPVSVTAFTVNSLFNLSLQSDADLKEWLVKVRIPCLQERCENAEEYMKSLVGNQLYQAIYKQYIAKQWGREPFELSPLAATSVDAESASDSEHTDFKYEALPSKGYTAWLSALLDHPRIDVVLGTNFFDHRAHLQKICSRLVYTERLDSFFADAGLNKLEFRSVRFTETRYFNNVGYIQRSPVIAALDKEADFFRSVEYKHFLYQERSQHSIVVNEKWSDGGEPLYLLPTYHNIQLLEKYRKLAEVASLSGSVLFAGHLANYNFFSVDRMIANALEVFYSTAGMPKPGGHQRSVTVAKRSESKPLQLPADPAHADGDLIPKSTCHRLLTQQKRQILPRKASSKHVPSKWLSSFEQQDRNLNWTFGGGVLVCLGRRKQVVSHVAMRRKIYPSDRRTAKIAVIIRGHFRRTDSDKQASRNLKLLLDYFPNAKVFIHSWTVRETSFSWRQKRLKKTSSTTMGDVSVKLLLDYYGIPKGNLGGIVLDSEEEILPQLRGLYSTDDLLGMVCSDVSDSVTTKAPKIGWLQMWWDILQPSALAVRNSSHFDAVLNFRHDAYERLPNVFSDWQVLRDLIEKYLAHSSVAPTDISCFMYRANLRDKRGRDTAWVTGAWSNYMLASKWVYEFKTMQDVFCHTKVLPYQEIMVPPSAAFLL